MGDYIQSIYNIFYYEGSNHNHGNSKKSSGVVTGGIHGSGSAAKRSNQGSGSGQNAIIGDSSGAGLKGIVNHTTYLV